MQLSIFERRRRRVHRTSSIIMKKNLNIAIDARFLGPRMHGIGRVVRDLLLSLAGLDLPHRFHLLINDAPYISSLGLPGSFVPALVKARPFSPREHWEVPRILDTLRPDLFHVPCIAAPYMTRYPTIMTIHDLIPFIFRKWWDPKPLAYLALVLKKTSRRCRAIIADSEHTKKDVVKILGLPPDKVRVIYVGITVPSRDPLPWEDAAGRLGLAKPYLFCLSNPKPAKNIAGLIQAFEHFQEKRPCDLSLVIRSETSSALRDQLLRSKVKNRIRFIGYLEDSEMEAVLRNCFAFVFPSLYEGFGLPPLEAMARGVPVVASRCASLPEVVGDGGLLFDPCEPQEFAEKISLLMDDQALREDLSARGRERSQRFSSLESARATLSLYEEILSL
jgi:glycosyltransferase involved in cell wall biosynthesis